MDRNQTLDQFVYRLLEEKGITGVSMDKEVFDQVRADLRSRAEAAINAAILAHLPADKLEYFEKLLDQGQDGDIEDFCVRSVADIDEVTAAALIRFRESYLHPEHGHGA